jgi:hypothetical protein
MKKEKKIANKILKNKLAKLSDGFQYLLGVIIESMGELLLIIIAFILSLVVTRVTDVFNIKGNLIPLLIFVFIGMMLKELGVQIKNQAYLIKRK